MSAAATGDRRIAMPRSPALSLAASTAAQSLHANHPTDPLSSTATHPPPSHPSHTYTLPYPGVSHPPASPTPQRQRGSPSSLWTAMFAHRLRFDSPHLSLPTPTFFLRLNCNSPFRSFSMRCRSFYVISQPRFSRLLPLFLPLSILAPWTTIEFADYRPRASSFLRQMLIRPLR